MGKQTGYADIRILFVVIHGRLAHLSLEGVDTHAWDRFQMTEILKDDLPVFTIGKERNDRSGFKIREEKRNRRKMEMKTDLQFSRYSRLFRFSMLLGVVCRR